MYDQAAAEFATCASTLSGDDYYRAAYDHAEALHEEAGPPSALHDPRAAAVTQTAHEENAKAGDPTADVPLFPSDSSNQIVREMAQLVVDNAD